MNLLGNIIWLILGGLLTSVIYVLAGLVLCVTIVGIPFGYQLIKIGLYALCPFGKECRFDEDEPGCLSVIFNVIWVVCGWWEAALIHCVCGLVFCITIVGIPLGIQHFKIAKMSFLPFGSVMK